MLRALAGSAIAQRSRKELSNCLRPGGPGILFRDPGIECRELIRLEADHNWSANAGTGAASEVFGIRC